MCPLSATTSNGRGRIFGDRKIGLAGVEDHLASPAPHSYRDAALGIEIQDRAIGEGDGLLPAFGRAVCAFGDREGPPPQGSAHQKEHRRQRCQLPEDPASMFSLRFHLDGHRVGEVELQFGTGSSRNGIHVFPRRLYRQVLCVVGRVGGQPVVRRALCPRQNSLVHAGGETIGWRPRLQFVEMGATNGYDKLKAFGWW